MGTLFLLLYMVCLERFLCSFGHSRSEYKVVQLLVVGVENILLGALPPLLALMDVDDLLANLHYGVHVMGVYYGGDIVLYGNIVNKVVNHD